MLSLILVVTAVQEPSWHVQSTLDCARPGVFTSDPASSFGGTCTLLGYWQCKTVPEWSSCSASSTFVRLRASSTLGGVCCAPSAAPPQKDPIWHVDSRFYCNQPGVFKPDGLSAFGGTCQLMHYWSCALSETSVCGGGATFVRPSSSMHGGQCCTLAPTPEPPADAACAGDERVFSPASAEQRNSNVRCSPSWSAAGASGQSAQCVEIANSYCDDSYSRANPTCFCAPGFHFTSNGCERCDAYVPGWCPAGKLGAHARLASSAAPLVDAPGCAEKDMHKCAHMAPSVADCAADAGLREECPHACGLCAPAEPAAPGRLQAAVATQDPSWQVERVGDCGSPGTYSTDASHSPGGVCTLVGFWSCAAVPNYYSCYDWGAASPLATSSAFIRQRDLSMFGGQCCTQVPAPAPAADAACASDARVFSPASAAQRNTNARCSPSWSAAGASGQSAPCVEIANSYCDDSYSHLNPTCFCAPGFHFTSNGCERCDAYVPGWCPSGKLLGHAHAIRTDGAVVADVSADRWQHATGGAALPLLALGLLAVGAGFVRGRSRPRAEQQTTARPTAGDTML